MKKYILIILLFSISCREEISLDLDSPDTQIVVQGSIEAGFPPYVILTKNSGYFDPIDINTYENLFIKNANVSVIRSDGEIEELEYIEEYGIYTNKLAVVSMITNSTFSYDFSVEGEQYDLIITWNNSTVNARTTIPHATPLDSIWIEATPDPDDPKFKCNINAMYTDPDTLGNNILIRSKRIQHYKRDTVSAYPADTIQLDNDPLLLLVDCGPDILINGTSFPTYFPKPSEDGGFPTESYRGSHYKTYKDTTTVGKDSVYTPEDIVLLKFCQVDEPAMRFWRGVVRNSTSGGNPFAEPMNLVSNINGGLGAWTGYGATYYNIPIIEGSSIMNEYQPNILEIF